MTGPTTMGVFVVGENGSVFEKLDTSSTFEQIDDDAGFPDEITQPLFDVEVLNGGDNVRIGSEFGGVVLFRDDGTWRRVNSATDVAVLKLSFPTADEVFAIGYSFFVSHYLDD